MCINFEQKQGGEKSEHLVDVIYGCPPNRWTRRQKVHFSASLQLELDARRAQLHRDGRRWHRLLASPLRCAQTNFPITHCAGADAQSVHYFTSALFHMLLLPDVTTVGLSG